MNKNLGPFLRCLDDLRDKPCTVVLNDNPPELPLSEAAKCIALIDDQEIACGASGRDAQLEIDHIYPVEYADGVFFGGGGVII
jgi:hypothetical protein